MEPLRNKQEQHVREQLRQHEFPFDERAWAAMEVLLAEAQRPGAIAPWRRYGWWVLLLAIASVLLLWQARPMQRKEKLEPQKPPAGPVAEVMQGSGSSKDAPVLSVGDSRLLSKTASKGTEKATSAHFSPNKKASTEMSSARHPAAGRKSRAHERTQKGLFLQPLEEETLRRSQLSEMLQPSLTGYPDEASQMVSSHEQALETLEALPPAVAEANLTRLTTSGNLTLLLPADLTPRPPRIEHGLTLGLGASVMQWQPFAATPAPVLGYLFRYRFGANTSLQAEAQVKSVSGYSLGARVQENTPGGPLMVSHEVEGLLFVELPIGVHHRYRPDQAFYVGVRPSWNMPMRTQTTAFLSSPTPTGEYSVRRGLHAFDVGISVGWEWRLHPQWALDARLTQGTTNLAAEGFFDGVNRLYNTDFQVSLRYFTAPDRRALTARL